MGTQTTSAIAPSDFSVDYSLTGTGSWVELCGYVTSVKSTGGDRKVGEAYTACGDDPITTTGKSNRRGLDIVLVYTEADTDPYLVLWNLFKNQTKVAFRWSPKGGTADDKIYTTALGYLVNVPPPDVDASSADPITVTINFTYSGLTCSGVAS